MFNLESHLHTLGGGYKNRAVVHFKKADNASSGITFRAETARGLFYDGLGEVISGLSLSTPSRVLSGVGELTVGVLMSPILLAEPLAVISSIDKREL